jgi:hypothetical protein
MVRQVTSWNGSGNVIHQSTASEPFMENNLAKYIEIIDRVHIPGPCNSSSGEIASWHQLKWIKLFDVIMILFIVQKNGNNLNIGHSK